MTLSRRDFLKLGAISAATAGAGYWLAEQLGDGAPTAESLSGAPEDWVPWSSLTRLVDSRRRGAFAVHGILVPSGLVLMFGGATESSYFEFFFDPDAAGAKVGVEPLALPVKQPDDYLECGGHAYLADGRLLVAGGSRSEGEDEDGLDYAVLYDTASESWERVGEGMAGGGRWYPAVTRLPDSRLLVTSGFFDFGEEVNRSVELFDPAAHDAGRSPWRELISNDENEWEIEPTGEDYAQVHVLPKPVEVEGHDRQVAMVGKSGVVHLLNYTDSFSDPNERIVSRPRARRPGPPTGEVGAASSSLLLGDGRILIVGGSDEPLVQARADIYDPIADVWESINTRISRHYPTALLLPDGSVLIANGEEKGGSFGDRRMPQIFDPETGEVTDGPRWSEDDVRGYHNVALLLADGRVLIAGGAGKEKTTPNNERTDLRFYSPPYLSRPESRPRLSEAPAEISYAQPFSIGYENGPVHRVTLLGLGAMTHCFDQNQRFIELFAGESTGGEVSLEGPIDASAAPPGDYLLFLLRRVHSGESTHEVPSVAAIVRVLAGSG